MWVRYLYHSGVAVRTAKHLLIFDCWRDPLPGGVPALVRKEGCPALVFASHAHGDHFSSAVLKWRRELPDVTYILSDDIAPREGCRMIGPGAMLEGPDYTVWTLRSTDAGVAFLVELDGVSIYHAGDLHWWHWTGEPEADNRAMAGAYRREIAKLEGRRIDLAFVPVDGRQEEAYDLGIDHFAAHVPGARLVPIHFTSDERVLERLAAAGKPYADRLCILNERTPFAELG